jgi:hypothetical protein
MRAAWRVMAALLSLLSTALKNHQKRLWSVGANTFLTHVPTFD